MPLFGTKLLDVQFDDKALMAGVTAATTAAVGGAARMARAFDSVAAGGNKATAAVIALSGAAGVFDSQILRTASNVANLSFILTGLKGSGALLKGIGAFFFSWVGSLTVIAGLVGAIFFRQRIADWIEGVEEAAQATEKLGQKLREQEKAKEKASAEARKAVIEKGFAPIELTDPRSLEAGGLRLRGGVVNQSEAALLDEQVAAAAQAAALRKRHQQLVDAYRESTGFALSERFSGLSSRGFVNMLRNNPELRETRSKALGQLADLESEFSLVQRREGLAQEARDRARWQEFRDLTFERQTFRARQGPDLTSPQMLQRGLLGQLGDAIERKTFEAGLSPNARRFLGLTTPPRVESGFADFSAFRGAGGQGITGVLDKQTRTAELSLDELKQIRMGVEQLTRAGGMG